MVESIDRLGRQSVDDMDQLVRKILKAGVDIVTLQPERHLTKSDLDNIASRLEILIYASRAREESETKSMRGVQRWEQKRKAALANNTPVGAYCPSWLVFQEGKFQPIKEKVAIVKRIFKMVIRGYGAGKIAKELNAENVPSISRRAHWEQNYIKRVLHSRSVLGEYVPHLRGDEGRKPTSHVLPNYYPRVISDEIFHKVQAILAARTAIRTRITTNGCRNVFSGLLKTNGASWIAIEKGKNGASDVRLCCTSDQSGITHLGSIKYPQFERCVLQFLKEVQLPEEQPTATSDTLAATKAELTVIANRLGKLQDQLETSDESETFISAIRNLEVRKKALAASVRHLEQEVLVAATRPLSEAKSLLTVLEENNNSTEIRLRLRQAIANTIETIEIITRKDGRTVHAHAYIRCRSTPELAHVVTISETPEEFFTLPMVCRKPGETPQPLPERVAAFYKQYPHGYTNVTRRSKA